MNLIIDIVPPPRWNWNDDDYRIHNFVRDLMSEGGVLSGEHEDLFVLIDYNQDKPSKTTLLIERFPKHTAEAFFKVPKPVMDLYMESLSSGVQHVQKTRNIGYTFTKRLEGGILDTSKVAIV